MVGKKSIFNSPVFKREDSTIIDANGLVAVKISYTLDSNINWLSRGNVDYELRNNNQSYNITTSGELEILKDRKKMLSLFLKSSDTLSFDSEIFRTLPALNSIQIDSIDSVFRINDIPRHCKSFVFIGGALQGGYTTRVFNNTIDTFDFRNETGNPLTTSEVDQILIDLDAYTFVGNKLIRILGSNEPRSSTSDTAVTSLESRGVTVETYVTDSINSYSLFFSSTSTDVCTSSTSGTFYQFSDSFSFTKPFYTDVAGTILAPANWYSDGFAFREWDGTQWIGSGAALCSF